MGMSQQLQDEARHEWRELGFFFAYDGTARRWLVIGSPTGLRKFCKILTDYATSAKHEPMSEHEHYGPYQDLKLVTWHVPEIRSDGIYGRLADFARLADAVEDALRGGATSIALGRTFAEDANTAENELVVRVTPDDFDPAVADAAITNQLPPAERVV